MSAEQKEAFLQLTNWPIPVDYVDYLFSNRDLDKEDGTYLVEASELHQYNAAYEAADYFTGYFLIGSTGSGEAIAIEKATGYFVLTPFIGHDEETPITNRSNVRRLFSAFPSRQFSRRLTAPRLPRRGYSYLCRPR